MPESLDSTASSDTPTTKVNIAVTSRMEILIWFLWIHAYGDSEAALP